MMRVLHFHEGPAEAIRLQRFVQIELDSNIKSVLFVRKGGTKKFEKAPFPWISKKTVPQEYFEPTRELSYLIPPVYDRVGLKNVFKEYKCDLVHAHNASCAYYAHRIGLPTLFDDWEYFEEYHSYQQKRPNTDLKSAVSSFLSNLREVRARTIVKKLVRSLPVIVTNDEVESRYRELGAKSIWWVPNVPLSREREYAFATRIAKRKRITTCYVGDLSADENSILRNTSGVRQLWRENEVGDLLVLEGNNYVPHLETLRKLRECHFNLLYWKPLAVHKYYLQNKPFLASVVGVPTIISSSLKATIKLLGEYALPVDSLEDIPTTIKNYDYSKKYHLNLAHLLECYQYKIKAAYDKTLL